MRLYFGYARGTLGRAPHTLPPHLRRAPALHLPQRVLVRPDNLEGGASDGHAPALGLPIVTGLVTAKV